MEVSQGSGVCAALCIRRTLCRHVTIGTPIVIFCCLTVLWLFLTVYDWYTVGTVLVDVMIGTPVVIFAVLTVLWLFWRIVHCTDRQKHSNPLVYQSSQVYQDCTNSVPTVYQSSKTVKRQSKQQKWPLVYQSSQVYQDYQQFNNSLLIVNKNLAIAAKSRVSCAHNMSRAFIDLNITPWPWTLD